MKAPTISFVLLVIVRTCGAQHDPHESEVLRSKAGPFGSSISTGTTAVQLLDQSVNENTDLVVSNLFDSSKDLSQRSGLRGKANTSSENIKQDTHEHRTLQQPATNVNVVNDCGKDVYASFKYRKYGNEDKDDPFMRQGATYTINGVTDPRIESYGLSFNWQTFDYDSIWPGYCNNQCYRSIYLGALNGRTVEFRLCGSPVSQPPPPSPTRQPTRPPTRLPTRSPTRPPTPRPVSNPIPAAQDALAREWLNEHNSRRASFYAQHGLGRMDLKWADSIAVSAQRYADKIIRLDGCHIEHGYGGDSYGGENLAANWGSGNYAVTRTPKEVLTSWYDDQINLPSLGDKLHATQVVFRSSLYLGCGQAEKDLGNGQKCFIHVCRYVSNGNCFTNWQNNWLDDVLSDDRALRCLVDRCENMPEGCF